MMRWLNLLFVCGLIGCEIHVSVDKHEDTTDSPAADLAMSPPRLVLLPGEHQSLEVTGYDVSEVVFSSSNPAIAIVDAQGRIEALDWGETTIQGRVAGQSAAVTVIVAEEELRGVWVTRWTYNQPDDLEQILDEVAAGGLNTVFLQVRGEFDAFYDSSVEPWSKQLTGTLGEDPGWDPLAVAVEGAHARGLALHPWLNTYPMWRGTEPPQSVGIPHALENHPDWVVHDAGGIPQPLNDHYVSASPGNPAVRSHLLAVVDDIASRYAVDGIHLDYIRYPGPEFSHDPASLAAWGEDGPYADWQRQQIIDTLLEARSATSVPLTTAVWGIYEDQWSWGTSQGNVDYYQDTRAFLAQGAVDGTMPMIYWPVTEPQGERLDFATLAQDHLTHAADRHVYLGISSHDLTSWSALMACIDVGRQAQAPGMVFFEYRALRDKDWFSALKAGPFANPAVPPAMPWRNGP